MNFAADMVAEKLRGTKLITGWPFHTASIWARSFPPYADNFSQKEFDQTIGQILNARRQAKRLARSKKVPVEKTSRNLPVFYQEKLELTMSGYPD